MSRSSERELIDNLEATIKEQIRYNIDNGHYEGFTRDQVIEDLQDRQFEIIDGEVPIYYHDMAKLLAENTRFADVEELSLPENPTVWDIISTSIVEWLSSEFYDIACEAVDELMPELSEDE